MMLLIVNIYFIYFHLSFIDINKNSLFYGESIGKLNLCVKTKAITRCRTLPRVSFERKLREGCQEETSGTF